MNDVVRLTRPLVAEGLAAGALGTVVAVLSVPGEAYEIEFCDETGATVAQVALQPGRFEVVG